jgi:hypothetical protein
VPTHRSERTFVATRTQLNTNSSLRRPLMVASCTVAAIAASAHASVTNGSFEDPALPSGSFVTLTGGSSALTGWTVLGDRVTVIDGLYTETGITFNSQSGDQWLDLTGPSSNSPTNGVSQNIPTTVGLLYRVSFYVGSATNNANIFASTVDLSIAGGVRVPFTNPVAPRNSLDWQLFTADFVATSAVTNIAFFNGSASNNNLSGLDNVTVEVVPTPGAAALLGIGGFLAARRRRTAAL